MADSNVRVPPDSTGKKIDASSLDVGADTVYRQRIVLADNSATSEYATIVGGLLQVGGSVGISGTAQVAISTPFTVNDISATVTVTGSVNISATATVVLGAGAANIGMIDRISRTVSVICSTPFIIQGISTTVQAAIATPFTVNDISRTVQVAVATPFTVNNISATVTVVGNVNISATASVLLARVADSTTGAGIQVGDSANSAIRVSIVAGGAGVASQVSLAAGTANIGSINNISATVQVAISTPFTVNNISATVSVVLGAGSANIGTLNNVSATVTVAGVVGLTAGTANIGSINHISRTVAVAVSTPFTVNNISATVQVAITSGGSGFSIVDGTSFTSQAASFVPIGGIFDDTSTDTLSENDAGVVRMTQYRAIHANLRHSDGNEITTATALPVHVVNATTTSTVVIGSSPFIALPSASHGPKNVQVSTSAAVVLVADPGASNSIYITQIMAGNFGSTLTRARIGTSASASYIVQPLAANGGGFVLNFDPPWKLSANSTAICSVKPNVSEVNITVNFYVAPT